MIALPDRNYRDAGHLIDRELSLLQFQCRVLAQAADPTVPLLERLRFLCIVSSNLDEFFEIRVSGIRERIRPGRSGILPTELLALIGSEVRRILSEQYALLNDDILPALEREGIVFLQPDLWDEAQSAWIRAFFRHKLMPVLTPIGLDPARPFPKVFNKSLNFAVELEGRDAFGRASNMALVQAPRTLPRAIRLPDRPGQAPCTFVLLSSVLRAHVGELFDGMRVQGCHPFRVTRNSNLFVDEEEVKDLRAQLKGELQQRHYGDAVRLEVGSDCPRKVADSLLQHVHLGRVDLYTIEGVVNLICVMQVPDCVDRPDLKYPPFCPGLPKALEHRRDLFEVLRERDILLHHPFQSFDPVIELLRASADDPQVVATKMTVYRTGTDSVLMEHLVRAAKKGKEVTVVFELMARFDEETNISWASRLEEAGAHVVYGVLGYKVHAKLLMLVRRESDGSLRRYVHLGTGNYHPLTTRLYTDFGLLTANEQIGEDVTETFRQITGLGQASALTHLWQAPFSLQPNVIAAIENEVAIARAGRRGRIIVKVNALLDPETIGALYRASCAGVEIDLIVRGPCALRPGVPGLSENIRVRSLVGRFLEHHRIMYFRADGQERVYLSSADWMQRNFFRRVEIAFPVLDPQLKRRVIKEGLRCYLLDNAQTWEMQPDGHYRRKTPRRAGRGAQNVLLAELAAKR